MKARAKRCRSPRQERSRKKVAAILAAARQLLEQEGAEALNTNRIALEAGISVATLYEYFPNKGAIAHRLIEQFASEEATTIMQRFEESADRDLEDGIAAIVRVVFEQYVAHSRLIDALWSMRSVARTIGHRPGEQIIMAAMRERLGAHRDALSIRDLDLVCFVCFHMVESLAKQMVSQRQGRWDDEACIAEITTAAVRYLGLD